MKKILALSVLLALVGVGAGILFLLREPEVLGRPFSTAAATPFRAVLDNPGAHIAADLRIEGRIVRQCPSAGCWFILEGIPVAGEGQDPPHAADGARPAGGAERQVRVDLGQLGLRLPRHVGGIAEVEGRLRRSGTGLELIGTGVRFKGGR